MKRAGNLMPEICTRENLAAAAHLAARSKRRRAEVRAFFASLWPNLNLLAEEFRSGDYCPGAYRRFTIQDPKQRTIHAAPFRDRVAHHALMAIAGPIFDRRAVNESCACRLGRGNSAALALAQRHTVASCFFLKLDIRRYFDSIEHATLRLLLRSTFKDLELLAVFDAVLESYAAAPGRGLPIGALTSQFFANFYLDGLDRFIKERLHVRRYVRFMDDFILWSDDRAPLDHSLNLIAGWLGEHRGLELKGDPASACCGDGVDFLGFRLKAGRTMPGKHSRRRYRSRLREYQGAFERCELDELGLQRRLGAATSAVATPHSLAWRRRVLADFDF